MYRPACGVQNVQAGVQDVQAAVQSVTAGVGDVQSGVQDVHTAVLGVQDAIGGFGSAMEEFYTSVDEGREKIFAQMARSDEARGGAPRQRARVPQRAGFDDHGARQADEGIER